ncbi:hypothetical protein UAW_01291 [Enterococcus haemoperoxidus ATCC BAA-382]|uniref:Uncharacterized protein n=1 Tax=Enterococcus haemoperoxidus ATCC BAA-382 TaxID=1158608 RepID=R2STX1_9ENTE|nr:hypothetical protein UAW_01291 [Enterococcus haemoperoxidus ATCC BAA-382]EOT62122.1 hypothetical protein I583_01122 [Enterococcus haemoperoxidus ATCC BAA-382]
MKEFILFSLLGLFMMKSRLQHVYVRSERRDKR